MNAKWLLWVSVVASLLAGCVSTTTTGTPAGTAAEQAEANLNLGAAYLRQGRADLALEKLERALSQDPRLAMAHSTIALAYDELGDPEMAEQHYRRATQLEPGNAAAVNSYAVFLCRHQRWREAEPYFQRAASNPRYATPAAALTNAGVCARGAGELDKAEANLRAALDKDPKFPDALYNLADLSYERQSYLQARAFTQRYLDAQPATAPVLWLCFSVEEKLDNPDRAEQCARQLKRDFPSSPEMAQLQQFERNVGQ
jgi:type IV pilus assembly protein PilF